MQRTREVLHRALISLMVEKGYDAVTVQHIIDRANVGRSTFYAHYDGKEDLLRSGMKNLSKQLLGYQRAALALKGSFRERHGDDIRWIFQPFLGVLQSVFGPHPGIDGSGPINDCPPPKST